MKNKERCEICKFSYPEMGIFSFCRRYAPKEFNKSDYGKFPVMHNNEWCGEFQLKISEDKNED